MSRSKKDWQDTEVMLSRLSNVLYQHGNTISDGHAAQCRADAEQLRRISMTLHRWHELECGSEHGCISRDEHSGKPYWISANYQQRSGTEARRRIGQPVPDREAGALKRLAAVMARYPSLSSYVQSDPRGCALYVLRPGDVPAGESPNAYYSRGLAVHQ